MIGLQVTVSVPAARAVGPAMINLHKPYAALNKSPCGKTILCKCRGGVIVQAIRFLCGSRFLFKAKDFRNGTLHAKRQLVRLDSRTQLCIRRVLSLRKPV